MQERIQAAYLETSEVLNALYKKRKRTLLFQKIMWGITGLYFLWMAVLLAGNYFPSLQLGSLSVFKQFLPSQGNPYANIYPIVGLLILLYPTTFLFAKAFQKFKLKEQETMAKMVRMLFPHVEFTQGPMAPAKEVVKSKFFVWIKEGSPIYSYGQIRSRATDSEINIVDLGIVESNVTNRFLGTIMHVPILNMFVVLYQNAFKNIAMNKLADTTNYSFRGMFCWLRFKKKLNGHTVVLPNNQTTKWNRLSSFNFKEEHRIHLEDPRFTNGFMVYGTDQEEARYVLSSSVMERIVALKEKFDRPIFLSFQNRQMYLAVLNNDGLFSFPSGNLDSIKVVNELAYDIETALEISKALGL